MPARRAPRLPALGLAAILLAAAPAAARAEADSDYSKAQTYSGALRFLRVDNGYEIVEQDPDAAYLLFHFELPGQKRTGSGSVEVIETQEGVKIYIKLPALPEYHETVLRDRLLKKLREEYGEPPPKAPKAPPKKKKPAADKQKPDATH